MRNDIYRYLAVPRLAVLAFVMCLVGGGCGSSTTTTPAPLPISVTLSPSAAQTLGAGKTVAITATVANDSSNRGVTWTLSPATGQGTLSGSTATSTTYTAPAAVTSATTVTVTATAVGDASKTATLTINLVPISVALAPSTTQTLVQAATLTASATVTNDVNSQGVTWALSPATGRGTLTGSTATTTVYNAPASVTSATSVTLTATSVADPTKSATLTINLVPPPVIGALTPTQLSATQGLPYTLTVNESGGIGPYTWAISTGALPAGLTLGTSTTSAVTITGTPTTIGAVPFTIKVTDSQGLFATAALTITVNASACGAAGGNESSLQGQYAFSMQGFKGSTNATPVALAASFNADGTGKITTGEEDINGAATGPQHLTIIGGQYVVGSDNRGCATLADSGGGVTIYRFALVGFSGSPSIASRGRIIEFDDTDGTGTRGSGTLRLQTTSAFLATQLQARYAFGLDGFNSTGGHYAMGGSFSLNNITGSLTNVFTDIDNAGTNSTALTSGTGTLNLSISPITGRATATLKPDAGHTFGLAIYIINANEFFAVTTDALDSAHPILAGRGIVTASSFTSASLSGTYVIHVTGKSTSSSATIGLLTFTPGTTNTVSGTLFQYNNGVAQTQLISGGTYSVDPTSGRVSLVNVGTNAPAVYLTSTNASGISAFIIGSDTAAIFGQAEFQPAGPYSSASLNGNFVAGIDKSIDPGETELSWATTFVSGTFDGTFSSSSNSGLIPDNVLSPFSFTINADGSGQLTGVPTIVAVTNGLKLFYIDESASVSVADIVVFEK